MMKTIVLIPAHNAGRTIGDVVRKVKQLGFSAIVVDDGSTDKTFDSAKQAGAVVITNEINMGKGVALRNGFRYILDNNDFDAVIMMDADGQHDPASLNDFIEKAELTNADLILGNRMDNIKKMPISRFIANRFMSGLLSYKIGQKVPDTQCGFRFIKKDLLIKLDLSACRYEIESEMLIQAARLSAHIELVSIMSIYGNQYSNINPIVDTWRFIRLMMKYK
jgi:glycosyltransferase involved in cell wall biosynthesis